MSSRRISDPGITAASHCGGEYETKYSASIETHIATLIDSGHPKLTDIPHEELYDEDYEDEQATEYKAIFYEEDTLLHHSSWKRNAPSIDIPGSPSIDTQPPQRNRKRALTDIANYSSIDAIVNRVREGDYSIGSWADDHHHESYAVETSISELGEDELHEGFTYEELLNMQRRNKKAQHQSETAWGRTRYTHPIDIAHLPSIDINPSTSIDIRSKPITTTANGAENLFVHQRNIPEYQQKDTKEFYDAAGGIDKSFKISEDEGRQPSHEAEIHGYDLGVPEKEEAISEAGKNVKESQLVLAEEEELESEARRNVIELEASSINLSDEEDDDESIDIWEDFTLEMRRLVEEAEKKLQPNATSPKIMIHMQSTLQLHALGLGVRRLITLTAHKRSKGTSENIESKARVVHIKGGPQPEDEAMQQERKATIVHIKGGPQPEDEAMQQGLQKPPASSNQRTEAKDPIGDPHKEITRCLDAKGKQEVTINNFLIQEAPSYHKTTSRRPYQYRGVVRSFLLKGEPPDLPPKIKPTKYQGKSLEFQKRMKPDLLYLGAGVNPNWKNLQSYSDQEDTNFKNQRFASPPICEYPSLEAVSNPIKKRSDQNQLMEFNMDLLDFQKAKNEEKSQREYGVMAQFSKPVKPVLQTKQWRPGEVYKHLRSISSRIRRIYLWPHLPYLEPLAIKLQQLFSYQLKHDLSTFQTIKKVPRKLSYPLKPFRFKKNQVSHLEPKSHKRLQRLLSDFNGLKGTASQPSSPSFHPVFILTDKIDSSPIHLIDPTFQPATLSH
ncbi:hypothetical protein IGI04_019199 [Brassica rapa subsp. trilocularis]|uniref:Uncharacterized protein n=1 Tax=Brassica rapa subsp. trilocularis TaxID=1813537 RepID=A0ABQ7MG24_BRACM|nr:hypothetical protein IGI04_019199 [Brassica rapa subsp. trilocularis]